MRLEWLGRLKEREMRLERKRMKVGTDVGGGDSILGSPPILKNFTF